jgi:hypothetical protein
MTANWEEEPERIAHQNWLKNLPKNYDERQKTHHGLTGIGAQLREQIKIVNTVKEESDDN